MTATKIIFNETNVQAAQKVAENVEKRVTQSISKLAEQAPDSYFPLKRTIVPFYNKFLPKFLRRTTNLEFYPNTQVVKTKNVYNHENQIIKSQSFDETGFETYFEKYNPKTKYSFTRVRSEGKTIEQEMIGNVLLRKTEKNAKGIIIYEETFNPKTNIHRKEVLKDGVLKVKETVGKKEIHTYERAANGESVTTYTNLQTKKRYIIENKIINGHKPIFTKLTRQRNDGSYSIIEYKPGYGYKYSQFDAEGNQLNSNDEYLFKAHVKYLLQHIVHNNLHS